MDNEVEEDERVSPLVPVQYLALITRVLNNESVNLESSNEVTRKNRNVTPRLQQNRVSTRFHFIGLDGTDTCERVT